MIYDKKGRLVYHATLHEISFFGKNAEEVKSHAQSARQNKSIARTVRNQRISAEKDLENLKGSMSKLKRKKLAAAQAKAAELEKHISGFASAEKAAINKATEYGVKSRQSLRKLRLKRAGVVAGGLGATYAGYRALKGKKKNRKAE